MAIAIRKEHREMQNLTDYLGAFSRIVNSVLDEIDRAEKKVLTGNRYLEVLQAATQREFPYSKKPLDHVAHWILNDCGVIEYTAAIRYGDADANTVRKSSKYSPEELKEKVTDYVGKHFVVILSRDKGQEVADRIFQKKKTIGLQLLVPASPVPLQRPTESEGAYALGA